MASDAIDFELIPPDGPEVGVDLVLAEALQVDDVEAEPDIDETVRPLGRGWAFDFVAGEFIRHGRAPAEVSGVEQLTVWIEMALRTARFAHPVFSDDFGMDDVELVGRHPSPDLLGRWASAAEDALLMHDRITAVRDFMFDRDGEVLTASFTVEIDEGLDTVLIENFRIEGA